MSKKNREQLRNRGERERIRLKKNKERVETDDLLELQQERMEKEAEPVMDAESIEKEYDIPHAAPTTFQELDAMREAFEVANEVQQQAWDVQDLVQNILHNAELDPTEKADRIMDVADEYATRVEAISMMPDKIEKDLEVLQIEAILGSYDRHTSILQKAGDFVKRVLSGKERKRLEDSDFALPGKRKYPIFDKAHVRNALARAAQQIKGGGEGAADAKEALPKIRAAAKKFGIETAMEKSSILIEKDLSGEWRWVGKPSNNFLDLQDDIMSKAAHEKYSAWLELNKELAPVLLHWHTPGTAHENPVDFAMEHEGALIMSGKLTEPEAATLLKMQAQVDLGMSLQGFGMRGDPDDKRVITDYILYEVSVLPLEKAANPFTSFETITKEAGMDKLEYLATVVGSKEKAQAILEQTGKMQKQLQDAGITSKETVENVEEAQAVTPEAVPSQPPVDVNALLPQLVEAVGKQIDIEGLNAFVAKAQEAMDKVPLLEAALQTLNKEKDEELVEMLTPPIAKFAWSVENRPSSSKENKLSKDKDDEELEKAHPGVPAGYWLSEVTHTVPVQE
jgi:hypothetical protein